MPPLYKTCKAKTWVANFVKIKMIDKTSKLDAFLKMVSLSGDLPV
jgi:hypothetical protein